MRRSRMEPTDAQFEENWAYVTVGRLFGGTNGGSTSPVKIGRRGCAIRKLPYAYGESQLVA
jgi:hypothetical protein